MTMDTEFSLFINIYLLFSRFITIIINGQFSPDQIDYFPLQLIRWFFIDREREALPMIIEIGEEGYIFSPPPQRYHRRWNADELPTNRRRPTDDQDDNEIDEMTTRDYLLITLLPLFIHHRFKNNMNNNPVL